MNDIATTDDLPRDLPQTLDEARRALHESMAQLVQVGRQNVLKKLIGGIAHEFNQPLNVTKIICQGLLRDIEKGRFSEKEAKPDLAEIVRQMDMLSTIITDLCVFARRDEKPVLEANDLNALIRHALKFVSQQYKDHHIDVTQHLAEGLPQVMADPADVEQVCLQLLGNAREAVEKTGKKEMVIDVKTGLAPSGKEVVLEVADNGNGIPDGMKAQVLGPFLKTENGGKVPGLGLAICRKIIEEHRGKIEFESRQGEGTVFRVTLPMKG